MDVPDVFTTFIALTVSTAVAAGALVVTIAQRGHWQPRSRWVRRGWRRFRRIVRAR